MLDFDFTQFDNENFRKEFKEDSVREFIIAPLLQGLGFKTQGKLTLKLSKTLKTPTIIGSNKKIDAQDLITPDYVLYVDSKPHCVLDAKAPDKNISPSSDNERQVFYYAINKEVKAPYYALCNGIEFMLFETQGQELLFQCSCRDIWRNDSINDNFRHLKQYLTTPLESLRQLIGQEAKSVRQPDSWYLERKIPEKPPTIQKQAKARYFGCTAYFTRQSWDIVDSHIKAFSSEGDVVLDPFGGSGVTAIEAMMNGRLGIHTDLNPLSIFMVKALSAKCDLGELQELASRIIEEFEALKPKSEKEAKALLKTAAYYPNALDSEFGKVATQKEQDSVLWIPQDEILPKGSDVDSVRKLFSTIQLAELALLRKLIFKTTTPSRDRAGRERKRALRYSLMLGFYNTLTMCNLTFHETPRGGGVSGVYAYYRYRIAPDPAKHKVADIFQGKIQRIIKGKRELVESLYFYDSYLHPISKTINNFNGCMMQDRVVVPQHFTETKSNGEKIFQADATDLKEIESQSIDFIYTDPPYGAKIPYLDLSTLWNAWLDLPVEQEIKEKECIEKGSLEKTRYDYYDLMKKSLKEMYRVLKFNRWLAFVFQHQDPRLWQILVDSAENLGFEYIGSVRQDNGQHSFKKVQNPSTVLSGQIIIYFKKVDDPKARAKHEVGEDIIERMFKDIESIIVQHNGANLQEIWNGLIIKAVEGNYIDKIAKKFENFIPAINERFICDSNQKYHLREFSSFSNYEIPLEQRVEYFIKAMLGRAREQGKGISFNDIVFEVIPLSKNGVQANRKMVREILQEVAYEANELWYLKDREPSLFDGLGL